MAHRVLVGLHSTMMKSGQIFTKQWCSSTRLSTLNDKQFLVSLRCSSKSCNTKDNTKGQDSNGQLIYYGTLTPRIRAVKLFSITTSIAGIAAQPILMEQGAKIGGTPMVIFLCSFVGIFTFVTPVLLHFITKKYVSEIFYDETKKEYLASIITFFLTKKLIRFKVDDIQVPDVPGMFTTFQVGKQSLFVDPSLFTDPNHYVRLMGYDKPIDFKLAIKNSTVEKDKNSGKSSP